MYCRYLLALIYWYWDCGVSYLFIFCEVSVSKWPYALLLNCTFLVFDQFYLLQVAPYCASKWAVEGLSRSVAKELPEGMAIVALNPGVIHTDMLTSCFGTSASLYQDPDTWYLVYSLLDNLCPLLNKV